MINQLFIDCIRYLLNSIFLHLFPLDATYTGLFIEDQNANIVHQTIELYEPSIIIHCLNILDSANEVFTPPLASAVLLQILKDLPGSLIDFEYFTDHSSIELFMIKFRNEFRIFSSTSA